MSSALNNAHVVNVSSTQVAVGAVMVVILVLGNVLMVVSQGQLAMTHVMPKDGTLRNVLVELIFTICTL